MNDPFSITSPDNVKLLKEYLDARYLEPDDFPLGLAAVRSDQLLSEYGYNARLSAGRPFILLDYLDANGERYYEKEDTEKANPYRLARFLGPVKLWAGAEPPPKVIAQNGRANVLHYEPLVDKSPWANLPDGTVVLHVESMIKAKVVSKFTGYPCIGLNGVDSFSSSKRGVRFLYEDQPIDFSRFKNVVLFDSNTWKPSVADARERLMFKFKHVLGCKEVGYIDLPKTITGEDQGPDDFLRSEEGGQERLIEMIKNASEYKGGEHSELLKRMDRAIFCTKGGTVVDREDKNVRSTAKAREFYANINDKEVGKGGKITTIQGYNVWIESPHRTEVTNPAYEYLGSEFIDRHGEQFYNVYRESGPWPRGNDSRGDIEPVLKHLRSVMRESDLELLRSYAKFLKVSKDKPTSFPILYSDKRGVGKGWFAKMMFRYIGASNSTNATAKQFVSNFNAQLANKRLVVVNEFKVTGQAAKDAAMNSLKVFFGDEMLTVEPKGVDSYPVENLAGMIITANQLEDVPTDGLEDRRMFYVECHAPDYEPDWVQLHTMIDRDDVMNSVHDWVLGAADINFSTWKPPLDEARIRAIMASSSSVEAACYTVLADLRADEGKPVCVSFETVVQLLLAEGVVNADEMNAKTLTSVMKAKGWVASDKKYGKNGFQKKVWIVDPVAFAGIEMEGTKVSAEIVRVANLFGGKF